MFSTGNAALGLAIGLDGQADPSVPASFLFGANIDPLKLLAGAGALDNVFSTFKGHNLDLTLGCPFNLRGIINERGVGFTHASAEFKAEILLKGSKPAEGNDKPNQIGVGASAKLATDYGISPEFGPVAFTKTQAEVQVYVVGVFNGEEYRPTARWADSAYGGAFEVSLEVDRLRQVAIQRAIEDAFGLLEVEPREQVINGINRGVATHYADLLSQGDRMIN